MLTTILTTALAAPRAKTPPLRPLEVPDASVAWESHRLEAESRTAVLQRERQTREPEEMTYYDVTSYNLELNIFIEDDFISGLVQMQLTSLVSQLDTLLFHAGQNLILFGLQQDAVTIDYEREGDLVYAILQNSLSEGEATTLLIDYQANNWGSQGMMYTTEYNVQTGEQIEVRSTQSEPFDARHWWPGKDDTRDKADITQINVTTDDYNYVVSNGTLLSDVDNGDGTRTFTWQENWPMVSYLLSVCVAPYNHLSEEWEWEETVLTMHDWSWSFQTDLQQQWIDLGLMSLTAFSDLLCLYPYHDEKYGHAQYAWGGAMEHQTCSSMGFYNEVVIPHEAAHQWFGDKLTCDTFHHIWLNEGWAVYCEALFFEYWLGEEALHEHMTGEQYWGGGTIWIENPETENIFDGNLSYAKASWVVHMLRHVVGEEAFWLGVHDYLGPNEAEYHRTVTTAEFRGFMETASGMDLEYFFDQWIMGEYYPEYVYSWEMEELGREYNVVVNLMQEQVPGRQTFTMPLDLQFHLPFSDDTTLVIWSDQPAQRYEFQLEEPPTQVLLDPDRWVLRTATQVESLPPGFIAPYAGFLDENGDTLLNLPGESEFNFRTVVCNMGPDAEAVSVSLVCEAEGVEITTEAQEVGPLNFAESSDTLTFAGLVGTVETELAEFTLMIEADGWTFAFAYEIYLGTPNVLLVDADGGDDYELWLEEALSEWAFFETLLPDAITYTPLGDYQLIIWLQGDADDQLEIVLQPTLSGYVESGGHLVFTGQNFAEGQTSGWLENFCGVTFEGSGFVAPSVWGDDGEYLEGNCLFFAGGGAGNQTDMDNLAPTGDEAVGLMYYWDDPEPGSAAVIRYDAGGGAVATFGFGWEGVAPIGIGLSLLELTERTWSWATGQESISEPETTPATLAITAAYPNPFNPSLTIAYRLPQAGETQLLVYNILGERVASLLAGTQPAGNGSVTWQPDGLAAGVYFCRLTAGEYTATRKIMLVK